MLTVPAVESCGHPAPDGSSVSSIGAVHPAAGSSATEHRGTPTSGLMPLQLTLALTTGYHAGPLFIVQKRRAPVIHGGTLGGKRRRERERRNTPKWADGEKIREMYREAARMTDLTGEMHVVDHIVPLDGKIVCGLHWHVNMRVIHWLPNALKGWGVWPDMPFDQLELFEV